MIAANNDGTIRGRVAMVTGGTRGLGLGLARALGKAGASVAVVGRDPAGGADAVAALAQEGILAVSAAADVADGPALGRAAIEIEERLGAIDLLVCAAGVGSPRKPVWEVSPDDYHACFDINLLGVINAMTAVMPGMVERQRGDVVVIGGTYGHKGVANFSVYGASKWALRGLVKAAALDAVPHGVRVNMVSPGGVDGERIHRLFRESAERNGEAADAPLKRFLAGTALGRLVSEEDVAAALLHLVGPGGRMIIGQDMLVDSGTVV